MGQLNSIDTILNTQPLDPKHYHCWVGSDIPGGPGGPTQYSILNTLPLDPNPNPKHHYHCRVGSEVLSDIPGGLGGPTQYSILNTLRLYPNPRTLGIIITVGLGVRGAVIYTRGPRWSHSILNTQYFTLGP